MACMFLFAILGVMSNLMNFCRRLVSVRWPVVLYYTYPGNKDTWMIFKVWQRNQKYEHFPHVDVEST
jgi:hypothetical protein